MKNVLNISSSVAMQVLVVDDDPIHSFIAETLLKDECNIRSVNSGQAALEAIEKEKFDVILMDINLNDHSMDGIQVMRKIRFQRKHRGLKIIAVTANSDAREWYIKQGFDGHHLKPLIKDQLLLEINALMNRSVVIQKE